MNRCAILLDDQLPECIKVEALESESILDFCYRSIGCDCVEIVHAEGLKAPYFLIVDEEGCFKEEPKLNVIASTWYGTEKHRQQIVGKALVMKEVMTGDGPDIGFLTDEEAEEFLNQPIRIPFSLMLGFV